MPGHPDQPVRAPGRRSPDALVRRLPEADRGSVPGRRAPRPGDATAGRTPGPRSGRTPRGSATSRRSSTGPRTPIPPLILDPTPPGIAAARAGLLAARVASRPGRRPSHVRRPSGGDVRRVAHRGRVLGRARPAQSGPAWRRVDAPSARAGRRRLDWTHAIDPDIGINNITHVIFIVQENRSFDHYFGTFPGADGFPRDAQGRIDVCVPDPAGAWLPAPVPRHEPVRRRRPARPDRLDDLRGRRADGRVRPGARAIGNGCAKHPDDYPCRQAHGRARRGSPTSWGTTPAQEIPNYWAYAKHFVLQDRMFAPGVSWTLPVAPVPGVRVVRDVPGPRTTR